MRASYDVFRRGGGAALAALAATVAVLTAATPQPAAASSLWTYRDGLNGPQAVSCGRFNDTTLCAKVYCLAPEGRLRLGLDGIVERLGGETGGAVRVGGFDRETSWRVAAGPTGDDRIWEAGVRDMDRLLRRMKNESVMTLVFGERRLNLRFTLGGSAAAINAVERACADIRRGPRPGGPRPGTDRPGLDRPGIDRPGPPPRADRPVPPPIVEDRRPTQPTSPWRFSPFRGGGLAESCGRFGKRDVCAVFYCRRGELSFGLDGLNERRDGVRAGAIAVDGFRRDVDFRLSTGPRDGEEAWVADLRRERRFAEQAMRGSVMSVAIEPRDRPFRFTLRNSSNAVGRLLDRCDRVGDRRGRREARQIIRQYRDEVVGRWGDRNACRAGGWDFQEAALATPGGLVCQRVQVADAEGDGGGGLLLIRGLQCARRGVPVKNQEFEALRDGPDLLLRSDFGSFGVEIERGQVTIGRRGRTIRLDRCRRQ